MDLKKASERKQDSERKANDLDNRYGKIGISAVVAALKHKSVQPAQKQPCLRRDFEEFECD
jgi:hypothetical protein